MLVLATDSVTAGDAAVANLLGWGVLLVGVVVTVAWLLYLYR